MILISVEKVDKKTGEQLKNKKGDPLTEHWTDPEQHKTKVRDYVSDQLYASLSSSKNGRSKPIRDPVTNKLYIMTEGNSQVNRPERNLHIGPIIKEITEDEAKAERPAESATIEAVMKRLRELEEKDQNKDEQIASLQRQLAEANSNDLGGYDFEKRLTDFFAMDGRSHVKWVLDGKADDILEQLASHGEASLAVKTATKERQEKIK